MREASGEASESVRSRVAAAWRAQIARQGKPNSELAARELERFCTADAAASALLKHAIARLGLSARAYHRVLKLGRTIADLAGAAGIGAPHVAEAIQYRRVDRQQ